MLTKSFWNFTFLHYITFRKNTGCYSRFIRWASDYPVLKESSAETLTSLLRRYTPVPVGSSSAEGLASTRLTCSLVHAPVITPTLHLDTVGSFGATWFSPRQCSKLHRRHFVGLSDGNRILRCPCVGSSGATDFCRTHPFQSFFEFFRCVLLCLVFLLRLWDL